MSDKPVPLSNNLVPRWAILSFGIVFLLVLLALPFGLYTLMAKTQNQSHGMNLAAAAGLPFDSHALRPTSRENPEAALLAAHYVIGETDRAKVAAALKPVTTVPDDIAKSLAQVSPKEPDWAPSSAKKGPWFAGAGVKDGLDWKAVFDASTGELWIVATPAR